jgi:hypothetical protein
MPTPNSRVEPFVGYRVALATEADTSSLLRLAPPDPTVHALLAGQRFHHADAAGGQRRV